MNQYKLKNIIDKYLSGTANEQEIKFIDRWYQETENEGSNTSNPDEDLKNKLFFNINQKIVERNSGAKKNNLKSLWLLKVAAAVFFLGMISVVLYKSYQKPDVWTNFVTKTGGVKKIVLADSSLVWLNASSELKFNNQFNGNKREIWLTGEAYFDIKHNKSKPFIIHTNKLTTTVLGTAFNINAYHNNEKVIVTVNRGKVGLSVRENPNTIFLTKNQEGVYRTKNQLISKSSVNADHADSWITGDFVFKEMRFGEIVERLERKFDVNIKFSSESLKSCLLTANFRKDASVSEILDILCQIDKCKLTKDQKTNNYLLSGEGCN